MDTKNWMVNLKKLVVGITVSSLLNMSVVP